MNYCRKIDVYEGQKSQKIMSMIDNIKYREIRRKLPKLIKDRKLISLQNKKNKLDKELKETNKLFEERTDELDLSYDSYNEGKFTVSSSCRIPSTDKKTLQNAQDLYALGRKKEANEIWDKIIDKYKIGK